MSNGTETTQQAERLLKAAEIAKILNISKAFAYKLMQSGVIRTVRIAGARRVRRSDLENYIEENIRPRLKF